MTNIKVSRGKNPSSELKWEKINRHDAPLYEDVVKHFFSLLKARIVHFHVLICDFHEYDHRMLNKGNKYMSVSKTYYQLLLHRCCKLYGDRAYVHVRPDAGECTNELPRFQGALNREARTRFQLSSSPIRSINCESRPINIMQMNDIVLGAIASHRNGRHLKTGASPHKTHLAELVRQSLGVQHFGINTPHKDRRFTVWNWKPKTPGRPRS